MQAFVRGTVGAQDDAPPLPVNCDALAEPGGTPPAACVYGYVYLDGEPVAGASVTLGSESGYLAATTQTGPASASPYYVAVLSVPPLAAAAGDVITLDATASGQGNRTAFETVNGSQQVDIWLSTTCGPTNVGGIIASDTTWTRACGPYVVTANLLVQSGFQLTIEAGTTVQVQADRSLQVDGYLEAEGQANAMIAFTSAAPSPLAGDWGYLLLADAGDFLLHHDTLSYILLEYAGGVTVTDNGALRVDNAGPSLSHLTVRHNASDGIHFFNGSLGEIGFTQSYDNTGWGIYTYSEGVTASNSYLYVHHNGLGGIYIRGKGAYWLSNSTFSDNNGLGIFAWGISSLFDFYASDLVVQGNRYSNASYSGAGILIYSYMREASVTNSLILDNEVYGGTSRHGGGIACYNLCELDHNIIQGNRTSGRGGGIYLYNASGATFKVHHNVVINNEAGVAGGGIWHGTYASANSTIFNNTILWNRSGEDGAGLNVLATLPVLNNTILYNTSTDTASGGIFVSKFPVLNGNNLYANAPFDLSNGNAQGTANVNAESNYWGTTDPATIQAHIWDWMDDSTLGLVDFEPFVSQQVLGSPIAPVTGLSASAAGTTSIVLSWSASPESDLAGYKIYYDDDGPGFPYSGSGANEGTSPIIITPATGFTLTSLPSGSYHVTVTAFDINADGLRDQTDGNESWFAPEQVVEIEGPPASNFSASPTAGPVPLQVNFTNLSTGSYTACTWTFGDGGTSDQCANPSHTYTGAGVYSVSLAVSGPGGADTETKSGYITAYAPAAADFSGSPTSGTAPLLVNFTNLSSGAYATCAWNFGDGGTSSQCANPTHTYNAAGVFNVSLMVAGAGGTDTEVKNGYITAYGPPAANFSASPTAGPAPLEVNFTNLSTGDFNTCTWTFGDGGTSDQCANPSHTYTGAGAYSVSLAVSGPGGADTETKNGYITAYAPAAADFSGSPTSGTAPLLVNFTNLSSGAYATCAWAFGDGGTSSQCANPTHTYQATGIFTVSLTVSGAGGTDTETKNGYITASDVLTADFYATPIRGTAPLSVQFSNLSSGLYDTCAWTFGDGDSSSLCVNPSHVYQVEGTYAVNLTVSGAGGTDDRQRSRMITVLASGSAWHSGGPYGGYVNNLALAPSNPDVVYAGTERGLYKSTNGGVSWVKTGHLDLNVKSVAVAPNNANTIYSGTADGIYKSADGGATWQPKGLAEKSVGAVAIDPRNPAVLFAGTPGGIYKSANSGDSWVRKPVSMSAIHALLVDSDDSLYVYAVGSPSGDDGFYKSTDGGETWAPRHVNNDLENSEDVSGLAMTPAGAAQRALYAFSLSIEGDVYKSIDRGENWAPCNLPGDWWTEMAPLGLAVDLSNPNRVYLGAGEYSGQVYQSPDAGLTWQLKMNGLQEGTPATIVVDPRNGNVLVGLQNGGVYRSINAGENWSASSAGMRNTQILGLAIHPTNSAAAFATSQGRGHPLAKTVDEGLSWTAVADIPSGYIPAISAQFGAVTVDPQNPNTIYTGDGWEYTEDLYIYKSTNGGGSWDPLKFMNGSITYWEEHGVADIWVHPSDPSIVLVAVEGWGGANNAGGVYRSYNGGYAWTRPFTFWSTTLASDPGNPNVVYVGTRQCGSVFRSEDAGSGWTMISPSMPSGECWVWAVDDLEVDGSGRVYAATSAGLMRWDGSTWTQLTGFPGLASALVFDRSTDPDTLYIGTTSKGVYSTPDSGGTWIPFNAGLGDLSINRLALGTGPERILYAGTVYGGVWARDLAAAIDHKLYLPAVRK